MTSGIYKITNKNNNKFYIGSAVNIESRSKRHERDLKNNRHVNKHLQDSWNRYGEDNFIFEIIEECKKEQLIAREQHFIDTMNPNYNILSTAGSLLGFKHSEEAKQKMSRAKKGHTYNMGRKMTDKMKEILKNSRIGLPSPFKGRHHSDKFKEEQSKRAKGNKYNIGRKPTQENILKMQSAKRKKEIERLEDKKKIDYLSLDISDWIEKRKQGEN